MVFVDTIHIGVRHMMMRPISQFMLVQYGRLLMTQLWSKTKRKQITSSPICSSCSSDHNWLVLCQHQQIHICLAFQLASLRTACLLSKQSLSFTSYLPSGISLQVRQDLPIDLIPSIPDIVLLVCTYNTSLSSYICTSTCSSFHDKNPFDSS